MEFWTLSFQQLKRLNKYWFSIETQISFGTHVNIGWSTVVESKGKAPNKFWAYSMIEIRGSCPNQIVLLIVAIYYKIDIKNSEHC